MQVEVFRTRFGGQPSWLQQLEDWGLAHLPRPLRPLWRPFIAWLTQLVVEAQIHRTMSSVDRQAKQIVKEWDTIDEAAAVDKAVRRAELQHPDAEITVVRPQAKKRSDPKPAPYLKLVHPPDPEDRAQRVLGFGCIEARSLWYDPAIHGDGQSD